MRKSILFLLLAVACVPRVQEEPAKTTFQTSQGWRPTIDIRADAVMVYGANGRVPLEERLASWQERGYTTHFMAGIAWGGYGDYFTGKWDGRTHWDEGQVNVAGDTLWHGKNMPYIVPTENYLAYFKERHIKPVIDAGVDAIFLEEPEFWAAGGYSDSFKREWEAYYGTPWRPQDESPEATYLSSKLKYHLYYRALEEAFTYAKEYGRSLGRDIRCYVPTHSLLNYSQWEIVSPEASLASLDCVDGYIAQVWTGTSRVPAWYRGECKERVFETAYLEYGCMASMVAPTGRRVWFLTDPIEDATRDWEDFRRNYQATYTAQLLYPQIADYEVMPWPDRIYEHLYPKAPGSDERIRVPQDFSSMMQVMTNALQHMPVVDTRPDGSAGISVLMGNSLMFQRFPVHDSYDDPRMSNFYGLALPLIRKGVPVGITHIENLGWPEALKSVKLLLMTYANMKPLDPAAHDQLAEWVRGGGKLLYSATDTDPFQGVQEWWNTGGNAYAAPSDHLFERMGIDPGAPEGTYRYGKGTVRILRHDPKQYVMESEEVLLDAVRDLYGPMEEKTSFTLDRGPYKVVAVLEGGEPLTLDGCFIDLYDPNLPVFAHKVVAPGTQALLYDVRKAPKAPCILAAASRAYEEKASRHSYSYLCKGPVETINVTQIRLPRQPVSVLVDGVETPYTWDDTAHTCFLRFPNSPEGVRVDIRW